MFQSFVRFFIINDIEMRLIMAEFTNFFRYLFSSPWVFLGFLILFSIFCDTLVALAGSIAEAFQPKYFVPGVDHEDISQ